MNKAVIVTGRLVSELKPGVKLQRFSRARDPWFYIHVDRATGKRFEDVVEATTIRDYLFRYDRGPSPTVTISMALEMCADLHFRRLLDRAICIFLLHDCKHLALLIRWSMSCFLS